MKYHQQALGGRTAAASDGQASGALLCPPLLSVRAPAARCPSESGGRRRTPAAPTGQA